MSVKKVLSAVLLAMGFCFASVLGVAEGQIKAEEVIKWGSSYGDEALEETFRKWGDERIRSKWMMREWGLSVGNESMVGVKNSFFDGYRSALISGFGSPLTPELLMLVDVMIGDFRMVMWLDAWIDDLRTKLDLNTFFALEAAWEREAWEREEIPTKLTPKAMSELIRTVGYLLEMEKILSGAHKRLMDDWDILRGLKEEYDYIPEKAEQILKDQGLIGSSDAEIAARIKERISGQVSLEQAWDLIDEILEQYGVREISGPEAKEIVDILNGME